MRQSGSDLRPSPALAGLALIILTLGASVGGGSGCTLLLDTSGNPYKCGNDNDCARFPNAVCDSARKQCVPRLPYADSGVPVDTGAGGTSGLTCEVTFDNALRLTAVGPDGGLRPLPTDQDGGGP
jgi:hypothetical protein